jgi:hypothetical protein
MLFADSFNTLPVISGNLAGLARLQELRTIA